MNKKTIIISTIIILAIIAGGFWYFSNKNNPDNQNQNNQNNNQKKATSSEEEVVETRGEIDTSDWRTYRNEEYGLEFKYPNNADYSIQKERVEYVKQESGILFESQIKEKNDILVSISVIKNINNYKSVDSYINNELSKNGELDISSISNYNNTGRCVLINSPGGQYNLIIFMHNNLYYLFSLNQFNDVNRNVISSLVFN